MNAKEFNSDLKSKKYSIDKFPYNPCYYLFPQLEQVKDTPKTNYIQALYRLYSHLEDKNLLVENKDSDCGIITKQQGILHTTHKNGRAIKMINPLDIKLYVNKTAYENLFVKFFFGVLTSDFNYFSYDTLTETSIKELAGHAGSYDLDDDMPRTESEKYFSYPKNIYVDVDGNYYPSSFIYMISSITQYRGYFYIKNFSTNCHIDFLTLKPKCKIENLNLIKIIPDNYPFHTLEIRLSRDIYIHNLDLTNANYNVLIKKSSGADPRRIDLHIDNIKGPLSKLKIDEYLIPDTSFGKDMVSYKQYYLNNPKFNICKGKTFWCIGTYIADRGRFPLRKMILDLGGTFAESGMNADYLVEEGGHISRDRYRNAYSNGIHLNTISASYIIFLHKTYCEQNYNVIS